MSVLSQKQLINAMQFSWMNIIGPYCNCSELIHPGFSCIQEIFIKFKHVLKMVSKFYLVFHLIPYLLKLKKNIQQKRFISSTFKAILNFIGSMVFMAHLVCGFKSTLCTFSNLGLNLDGYTTFFGGFPTGISILWQSKTRRQEIAYYAFARSLKALYQYGLRRNWIPFEIPKGVFLIVFFGILSYFYIMPIYLKGYGVNFDCQRKFMDWQSDSRIIFLKLFYEQYLHFSKDDNSNLEFLQRIKLIYNKTNYFLRISQIYINI